MQVQYLSVSTTLAVLEEKGKDYRERPLVWPPEKELGRAGSLHGRHDAARALVASPTAGGMSRPPSSDASFATISLSAYIAPPSVRNM